jgi:MoxR-like ATPase
VTGGNSDRRVLPAFVGPEDVADRLLANGYLADPTVADAVFLADRLAKPVLVEGPAGVGKTELAKSVSAASGRRLVRLQCYEGLDEAKALYEWDYRKQLLRLQAELGPGGQRGWEQVGANLFSEEFLLARPLLQAIIAPEPVVLLVDEVDRLEPETEALLLEVLSEFQVSVPEIGTLRARTLPLVFLTSNATRDLSEALKRRCMFLPLSYPAPAREAEIIRLRVPEASQLLASQVARIIAAIRSFRVQKQPSVSEAIDWARALVVLGVEEVDGSAIRRTLPLLLKCSDDLDLVWTELQPAADRDAGNTAAGPARRGT